MGADYDTNNVFAKILRGEIPCSKVYENEYALAFNDIAPQAPVHVLVIPKGQYVSMDDFSKFASDEEVAGFMRAVGITARQLDLSESGYRIIANTGTDGMQEVPHLHIHVFGGKKLGAPQIARGPGARRAADFALSEKKQAKEHRCNIAANIAI